MTTSGSSSGSSGRSTRKAIQPFAFPRAVEAENQNLRVGLASRIVIEQAKGVLIERLDLAGEDGFELLRCAARRARRPLDECRQRNPQDTRHPRLHRTR